jgi:hypothetical protein
MLGALQGKRRDLDDGAVEVRVTTI